MPSLSLRFFRGSYELPDIYPSEAFIVIESSAVVTRRKTPRGEERSFRAIFPDCITFREVDAAIKLLKKDLEAVRRDAKICFKKEDKRKEKAFRR